MNNVALDGNPLEDRSIDLQIDPIELLRSKASIALEESRSRLHCSTFSIDVASDSLGWVGQNDCYRGIDSLTSWCR